MRGTLWRKVALCRLVSEGSHCTTARLPGVTSAATRIMPVHYSNHWNNLFYYMVGADLRGEEQT